MQEIVERDRIIEEKIEQIEQQNKILVEIQITLDEKQKQLADMEQKVEESEQKVTKLTEDLDKSCKVIQVSRRCLVKWCSFHWLIGKGWNSSIKIGSPAKYV